MIQIVSIEDEALIAELLAVVLESPELQLTLTPTAYEGMDAIRQILPDLIILDVMLPDVDGWTVYEALRADPDTTRIPVIFLSVLRREFQHPRPQLIGPADVYMTKPFDAMHLRREVENTLGVRLWN